MSMMKETDQTRLSFKASGILEAFLQGHITLREAVADLAHLCRSDVCHLNGPDMKTQLADTLVLAKSEAIEHDFALTHLVRLVTAPVLFEDTACAYN